MTQDTTFPENGKGTYVLLMWMEAETQLQIGRLGHFTFPGGWYTYVGSAFGSGGLQGRLRHHLKPIAKPHWHVDYLRQAAPIQAIWYQAGDTNQEHHWAGVLTQMYGAAIPVPRFGASDCTCPAHLFRFPIRPDIATFRRMTDQTVHCWPLI